MNFIALLLHFEVVKIDLITEGKPLRSSHIALFLAIFHAMNRSGWKTWTAMTMSEGMKRSCLNKRTYYKCLEDLKEWQIIDTDTRHDLRKPILIRLGAKMHLDSDQNDNQLGAKIHLARCKNTPRLGAKMHPFLNSSKLIKEEGNLFSFKEGEGEQEQPTTENNSEKPKQPKRKNQPTPPPAERINGRRIF